MKRVHLIHNPTAGDEAHNKDHLLAEIEKAGYECRYTSTKETGWRDNIDGDTDLLAIAGGDGTIRKVVKRVLKKKSETENLALAILAMGTANNIAKSLNATEDGQAPPSGWKSGQSKRVDIGEIENVKEESFFLEGIGFGIFPLLMKEMKENRVEYDSPEEELKGALKMLHKVFMNFAPRHCKLEVDDTDHSGEFFMVEVMNIRSIGPNLELAPLADPGDGEFEVVLVPQSHKEQFTEYLLHKIAGEEQSYQFPTLKGKNIRVQWDGTRLHVDDKLLKQEKNTDVLIKLKPGALQFLVPGHEPANG